ncbi:MAG: hypothetical protein RIS29_100 [Bacteroidota bacterium]|jgi:hypothetical protein
MDIPIEQSGLIQSIEGFAVTIVYNSLICVKLAITFRGLPKAGIFTQKFNRIIYVEPCTNAQLQNFSPAFWQTLVCGSFNFWILFFEFYDVNVFFCLVC